MMKKCDSFGLCSLSSTIISALAVWVVLVMPDMSWAITAPATGDFAYDLYDIAINDMLKGPVGFIGGASAIVAGCVLAIKQNFIGAVPCVLGGGGLIKADTLVTSLGLLC